MFFIWVLLELTFWEVLFYGVAYTCHGFLKGYPGFFIFLKNVTEGGFDNSHYKSLVFFVFLIQKNVILSTTIDFLFELYKYQLINILQIEIKK